MVSFHEKKGVPLGCSSLSFYLERKLGFSHQNEAAKSTHVSIGISLQSKQAYIQATSQILRKFENFWNTVVDIVWAATSWGLTQRNPCFSIRIILGTIPIWFLVFSNWVPACLRSGSGVNPKLWAQKKLVELEESA